MAECRKAVEDLVGQLRKLIDVWSEYREGRISWEAYHLDIEDVELALEEVSRRLVKECGG